MNRATAGGWVLITAGIVVTGLGVIGIVSDDAPSDDPPPTPVAAPSEPENDATGGAASDSAEADATTADATGTPTTDGAATGTPAATVSATDVTAFYRTIMDAIRDGDTDVLFDRLHPAVLDRYGRAQCRTYTDGVGDSRWDAELGEVTGPEDWDWERDGMVTSVPNAYAIDVEVTLGDSSDSFVAHVALADGALGWFTDCGEPRS